MPIQPTRRELVAGASLIAAMGPAAFGQPSGSWRAGEVVHILPTASDRAFRIKTSFRRPLAAASLSVDGRTMPGTQSDSDGRYWLFQVDGLEPDRLYSLQLFENSEALCEPWPLKTFPAREAEADSVRLLAFTCAGGLEGAKSINGAEAFRPLSIRHALLERGLSFEPDAVIANGDHIYWDQRAWLEHPHPEIRRLTREAYDQYGYFDQNALMFGTANEGLIKRLAEPQIAALYGTRLRSTPSFFVNDDHDYFENDDAFEEYVAFPPNDFQVRAARAVQHLFYPEFLPDPARPAAMSGASAPDRGVGVSECFGTLRYGRLLEAVFYDCGRFLTLKGAAAGLVPPEVEAWLIERTLAEDSDQLIHVPSHPMGWTAGKWREWYPDVVASDADGDVVVSTHGGGANRRLTTEQAKFMWQSGWFDQHQRLVEALCGQQSRAALSLSGDLHAIGSAQMTRSGAADLSHNPLHSVLSGPVSTSDAGWPTFARGVPASPSGRVTFGADAQPLEKNGFTIVDVFPDRMRIRQFAWREPQPVEAIPALEPFSDFYVTRP